MNQTAKSFLMVIVLAGVARASDKVPTGAGRSKPAEQRPGCFAESVRIPSDVKARLPKAVSLQFTVTELGYVEDVRTADAVEPPVATQLRGALARCDWTPGADARGVPVSVRVELPVRFELERVATRAGTSVPIAAR